MEVIGRVKARSAGLEFYFTGVPCKNGEITERRSSNTRCMCSKCLDERSSKMREYNSSYYDRTKVKKIAYEKERKAKDPVKQSEYIRSYRAKNTDKILSYRSEYHAKNRDRSNQYCSARRAARINRTPAWFSELDEFVMSEANHLAIIRREATGIEWEVDHMIPLQAKTASGLHVGANIQVLPMWFNRSKRNKMIFTEPFEWMSQQTL